MRVVAPAGSTLQVVQRIRKQKPNEGNMPMIPLGSDGEPRPDLVIKRKSEAYAPEDHRKSKWDMPYHQ